MPTTPLRKILDAAHHLEAMAGSASSRLLDRVAAPAQHDSCGLRVDDVQIELDSNADEATLTRLLRAVRAC